MFRFLLLVCLVLFGYAYWLQHRGDALDDGFVRSGGPGPIANPYGGGGGGGGGLSDRMDQFIDQVKNDVDHLRDNIAQGIADGLERLKNIGH